MRKRGKSTRPPSIYVVAGILYLLIAIFSAGVNYTFKNTSEGGNVVLAKSTSIPEVNEGLGLPARLIIPKIKVNAKVESVGLTSKGAMGVPKDPKNVAWFNRGSLPGGKGTAIIDGHFGYWRNGAPTVFNNLYKLKKGDRVSAIDDRGKTTTFVVRELQIYGKNDDASDVFYSSDGKAHLNLVTCEGSWDKVSRTYSNRLIVFTDKEIE